MGNSRDFEGGGAFGQYEDATGVQDDYRRPSPEAGLVGCAQRTQPPLVGCAQRTQPPMERRATLMDGLGNLRECHDVVASMEERVSQIENYFGTAGPPEQPATVGARPAPDNLVDDIHSVGVSLRLRIQRINTRLDAIAGRIN